MMKATLRLLANVKPGRYLEAGAPTGLTGLVTHPSPRSTLLFLYGSTLDKLKAFPEHSVYRQSAEALTNHRRSIIESIKPAGYDQWAERATEKIKNNPDVFQPGKSRHLLTTADGVTYIETQPANNDVLEQEWDGEQGRATSEGPRFPEEREREVRAMGQPRPDLGDPVKWETEPPLEASQINDVETQIGAGLVEEVIQVAEGELKLVDTMLESKVWEELEEKPGPGQWDYFTRDQHTRGTQEPPNK